MKSRWRSGTWASLASVLGAAGLAGIDLALTELGPSSRVIVHPYFFDDSSVRFVFAGGVGLVLGAGAYGLIRRDAPRYSVFLLAFGCALGMGLGFVVAFFVAALISKLVGPVGFLWLYVGPVWELFVGWLVGGSFFAMKTSGEAPARRVPWWAAVAFVLWFVWALVPQLRAFPAHGTLAERDAWAREHVFEYPGLARLVASIPEVTRDVGRVTEIAPTGTEQHVVAPDMDGTHLAFALDVGGEKGRGVFHSDVTLTEGHVVEWRPSRWTFGAKDTVLDVAPSPAP